MSQIYKKKVNKTPKNIEQWAADAYQALEKALIAFEADYPNPDEDECLELIGYAADIAADARSITDEKRIDEADEFAVDNILTDLDEADKSPENELDFSAEAAEPQYNILFLLCYLDVHVAFGLLEEDILPSIMDHLVENFDLVTD